MSFKLRVSPRKEGAASKAVPIEHGDGVGKSSFLGKKIQDFSKIMKNGKLTAALTARGRLQAYQWKNCQESFARMEHQATTSILHKAKMSTLAVAILDTDAPDYILTGGSDMIKMKGSRKLNKVAPAPLTEENRKPEQPTPEVIAARARLFLADCFKNQENALSNTINSTPGHPAPSSGVRGGNGPDDTGISEISGR